MERAVGIDVFRAIVAMRARVDALMARSTNAAQVFGRQPLGGLKGSDSVLGDFRRAGLRLSKLDRHQSPLRLERRPGGAVLALDGGSVSRSNSRTRRANATRLSRSIATAGCGRMPFSRPPTTRPSRARISRDCWRRSQA